MRIFFLSMLLCGSALAQQVPVTIPDADSVPVSRSTIRSIIDKMTLLKEANQSAIDRTLVAQSTTVDTIRANNVLTDQIKLVHDWGQEGWDAKNAADKTIDSLTAENKKLDALYHRLKWPICIMSSIFAALVVVVVFARLRLFETMSWSGWVGPSILIGSPLAAALATWAFVSHIV